MQLTCLRKENIIFNEPVKNNEFAYERIKIETKYDNNIKGPLVIETPFLFSFGVTERRSFGYFIPVCLRSKDEQPTPEEKEFYDCLISFQDICYEHLENTYGVEIANDLNQLLYRKENDFTSPPVLYAKLIYSQKSDKILTAFRTKGSDKADPLDYLNQYCKVKLTLLIESIYVGENAVSIQVKVHEAYVKPLPPRKSLLTVQDGE